MLLYEVYPSMDKCQKFYLLLVDHDVVCQGKVLKLVKVSAGWPNQFLQLESFSISPFITISVKSITHYSYSYTKMLIQTLQCPTKRV